MPATSFPSHDEAGVLQSVGVGSFSFFMWAIGGAAGYHQPDRSCFSLSTCTIASLIDIEEGEKKITNRILAPFFQGDRLYLETL